MERIQRIIETMSSNATVNQLLLISVTFVVNFFVPIIPIILTCWFCIFVDMYYGIKVSIKLNKNKPDHKVQSRLSWRGTISKLKDTATLLMLTQAIETFIIGDDSPLSVLTGTAAVVITVTELWSIIENLNTLNPDGPWRVFAAVLRKKGEKHLDVDLEDYLTIPKDEKDIQIDKHV